MSPPSQTDLVERVRNGDLKAFGELVREHQGWLRGMLRTRIPDWTAADDLVQDVFVTAFRRIKEFRGESEIDGWLRGIAMNHLRNHIRKKREEYVGGNLELEQLMERHPPSHIGSSSLDALHECLKRLDGESRDLLSERYIKGKSIRELSDASGKRYSALTMQLHRLREILAGCVKGRMKEADA